MDRRSRQAQTTADRYFYKFISHYVQAKYNEVYKEALALLERARAENPGVKDMVKTATYMRDVHPKAEIPRYYLNRNLKHRQQPQQPNPHNLKQMVLCIPLTSSKTPTSTQSVEPVQLAETPTSTQSAEAVHLPLSDEIYEGLIKELQADPDLDNILNNFSMDVLDTETSPLDHVQTDPELSKILDSLPFDNTFDDKMIFWEDEITPLEQEVETMLNKTV